MMLSLKECPFCNCPNISRVDNLTILGFKVYAVQCGRCFAKGPQASTPELAIGYWNARRKETKENEDKSKIYDNV